MASLEICHMGVFEKRTKSKGPKDQFNYKHKKSTCGTDIRIALLLL